MSKTLIFDIETNGLLLDVSKFWVGVTYCLETKETKRFRNADELVDELETATKLVGHNIIGYDLPALEILTGRYVEVPSVDTLLLSQLEYQTISAQDGRRIKAGKMPKKLSGRHSLEAWGYRLGEYKGSYDDWSKYTKEMEEYCVQDVMVSVKLYLKLIKNLHIPMGALQIEQDVQRIITEQHMNGWKLDIKKAQALHIKLLEIMEPLEKSIQIVFKPMFYKKGAIKTPKKPFRRLGVHTVGQHQPVELTKFNPSSGNHIIHWLKLNHGWEPTEFTPKGHPKTDAETLRETGFEGIKPLLDWLDANKLLTMLAEGDKAWLKRVRPSGRIHGSAMILGAVTGRFTHSNPNLAQVPSSTAFMGEEARDLFTVEDGYTLVGADASGLELRMLSHFLAKYDGGAYGKIVLEGDIHTANQMAAGLPTRDDAKTFIYGWLYGAGDAKIGAIIHKSAAVGKKLKEKFLKSNPAVAKLILNIQRQVLPKSRGGKGKKYLKGLSGRRLLIRSPHSALNTVLQSGGAYYMKYVLVELDKRLKAGKYDYKMVGNIHDEFQMEVLDAHVDDVMQITEQTFEDVGYMMGLRMKMAGEAKSGPSWKYTH